MKLHHVLLLSSLVFIITACNFFRSTPAPTETPPPPPPTPTPPVEAQASGTGADMYDFISRDGRFTILKQVVDSVGSEETLLSLDNATLIAPTDKAFETLPPETRQSIMGDQVALKNILLYHIIPERLNANDLAAQGSVETSFGPLLRTATVDGGIRVNDVPVIDGDIEVSNGIIHVVDTLLLPPADNSVIPGNVIEVMQADGRFTQFVNALEATGEAQRLRGPGPFTVLAPTDEAFAKLAPDALNTNANLILRHHTIPGRMTISELQAQLDILSAISLPIPLSTTPEGVVIVNETATVIAFNIEAANGIIHVIDQVMTPTIE